MEAVEEAIVELTKEDKENGRKKYKRKKRKKKGRQATITSTMLPEATYFLSRLVIDSM